MCLLSSLEPFRLDDTALSFLAFSGIPSVSFRLTPENSVSHPAVNLELIRLIQDHPGTLPPNNKLQHTLIPPPVRSTLTLVQSWTIGGT